MVFITTRYVTSSLASGWPPSDSIPPKTLDVNIIMWEVKM